MIMSLLIGKTFEALAESYLISKGLVTLEANVHSRFGEIDIIMKEGETIVFIEVKQRQYKDKASLMESISITKQKKIIKTALHFLSEHNYHNAPIRFDAVFILGNTKEPIWLTNMMSIEETGDCYV
jgi:putative endonuclease